MIPKQYIEHWKNTNAPWQQDSQVEQDLLISRILVEIYSNPFLRKNLAFKGGTALQKLFVKETTRYSEDIDLVQTQPVITHLPSQFLPTVLLLNLPSL